MRIIIMAFAVLVAAALALTFQSAKPSQKNQIRENPRAAFDALTYLSTMAAYPNKDIPEGCYSKAWAHYNSYFRSDITRGSSWTSIGPNNVGGRTLCVTLDPNDTGTVWLGSASGGLWKSTTGGIGVSAWKNIDLGHPVLGVSTIAINPSNNKEMFVGTGETYSYGTSTNGLIYRPQRGSFGMGILKSSDGGSTWSNSLNWTYNQNRGIWKIIYNPLRHATLYAATTEGVYKTTDAGNTWHNILNNKMVMDLLMVKSDTSVLLAGVGNIGTVDSTKGIYKTTDGGATWSRKLSGLPSSYTNDGRITLTAYPKNNGIIMALVGDTFSTRGVYLSKDTGKTWKAVNTGSTEIVSYQGWYCKCLMFNPDDSSKVLAGGVDIFESTDMGKTFTDLYKYALHSDLHDITFNPLDHNKIYVVTDGGLFRSNDFAATFYDANDGYVTSQFYIGSVSPQSATCGLGGLQDNNTYAYTGSNYWTAVVGGDGCYNAIDKNDSNTQYGAYQYLNVYKTQDLWTTGTQIITLPGSATGTNPAAFLAPYTLAPSNNNIIYAGAQVIKRSTNKGTTFKNVGPNPLSGGDYIMTIAVAHDSANIMYCATAPGIDSMHVYRTRDSGATFKDISGKLPQRYPRRIAVDPRNHNIVYIVFGGFGTGHVFKSENAGKTWKDISGTMPDIPFHCILVDPVSSSIVYVGCDMGLFVSKDSGSTWASYDAGLPSWTMVFDIVPSVSNNQLFIFTHGRGVYVNNVISTATNNITGQSIVLSMFPTLAHDIVTLRMPVGQTLQDIKVFDVSGRKMDVNWQNAQFNLTGDISKLPPGNYFISASSGGHLRYTGRFIKS